MDQRPVVVVAKYGTSFPSPELVKRLLEHPQADGWTPCCDDPLLDDGICMNCGADFEYTCPSSALR